jgi:hypothetical protein
MNKYGSSPYGPMHVGLFTSPLCPQTQNSNVLRVHAKGSQINMPECCQGFSLKQTQRLGFPPQPHYISFKVPKKRKLPYGAPTERRMFHLQSPLYVSLKVPRKNPPSRVPLHSSYVEKGTPSPEPS